jgi:DNA-binding NtrC family response regulator
MNVIESAYTFSRADLITLADLPATLGLVVQSQRPHASPPISSLLSFAETERDLIARALASTAGNKLQAAKLLGISRKKLYAKIAKYHLLDAG